MPKPKHRVKEVSTFYRSSDGKSAATASPTYLAAEPPAGALASLSGDFDETIPYSLTAKAKRFRAIEDVMDSTGRNNVTSTRFRDIEDVMESTGRKVKEDHFRAIKDLTDSTATGQKMEEANFRFIVDIMSSGGLIQDGYLVSSKQEFDNKIVKPFRAKVDKGKEGCLDEETKILRGRIKSFMAAMGELIGPRRCTRWGGSVVDSIVGVYLTQSVSDVLSSSAFMSLAAKFPAKSEVPSVTAEDFVTTNMPNDTSTSPTYMELLWMQVQNASKNETKATESLTNLLYCTDPSLGVKIRPPSMPTLGAQSKHSENDFPEAQVYGSETRPRGMMGRKRTYDFEAIRKETIQSRQYKESIQSVTNVLDLEAIRQGDVNEISQQIVQRGMDKMLGKRIQDFLNTLMNNHGSMDLEWLRHVDPETAKDYLLRIKGLGLKSVECVRLLTLHHKAFPVDTNVGRICVRLGWVPLQPLPESLQLYLLEQYPVLKNIHKYLWPRLCNIDHQTLYDLHYQMITFGKVFCTKIKPNCNACPLRAECKHFASELSSAKLPLPGPEPELEIEQTDIEDCVSYYAEGTRIININKFSQNRKNYMDIGIEDADMLSALVALTPEAGSIPTPKLKNVSRLRTEHQAYELPDDSPLLEEFDKREPDDTHPYLLCVLNPGETVQSRGARTIACKSQEKGELCESNGCVNCNSTRESQVQKIRGTILIPYRVAMRGKFPLGGTYFQLNEVFADHAYSQDTIIFPRRWIDDPDTRKLFLGAARTVYFGTSVATIFRGLEIREIVRCFFGGCVCVRAFDRTSRAPRPLHAMFHSPPGKRSRKGKMSMAGDDVTVEKKKFISEQVTGSKELANVNTAKLRTD